MSGESGTVNQVVSPVTQSSSAMLATPENEVAQLDSYKAGTLPAYMFNRSMTNPLSVAQYNQQVTSGGPITMTPTGTTIIRGKSFSADPGGQSSFGPKTVRTAADAQLEALRLPSDWNTYDAAKKINWYNTNAISADKLASAGASQKDLDWMKQNGYIGFTQNWSQQTPEQKIAYYNQNGVSADALLKGGVTQDEIDWMVSKGYNPRWVTTPEGWDQYTPQKKIEFFNNNNVSEAKLKQMGVPQSDLDWMKQNGYTGVAPAKAPLAGGNNNSTVVTTGGNNSSSGGGNVVVTGGGNTASVEDDEDKIVFTGGGNRKLGTNPAVLLSNGTASVRGYAGGTTGVEEDDPWSWTQSKSAVVAPLGASIQASNEQAGLRVPDQTEQVLGNMAMAKGIDAAEKGINAGYQAYKAAGPLANSQMAAADLALGGSGGTAGAAALTEAAGAGAAMAEAGAATSALGAGGTAMMGALASNPVGWAIGAGLLAKKLKLF